MKRKPEQILDEFLVLQAQYGDSVSIARLVNNWHRRFVRYANKIINDNEAAADVVQESWIAILKGIRKIRDPAGFKSWAFRIVHNKSYDSIRSNIKRKTAREEYSKTMDSPDTFTAGRGEFDHASQPDDIDMLRAAISRLKSADQMILTLYYEEDLSIKEIQQVTGDSISSLKSRLHHVRQRLKTILERNKNEQQQH